MSDSHEASVAPPRGAGSGRRPIQCTRIPFVPATRSSAVRLLADESGAATAEYAIATMAAVAFAGMLVVIMRSDEVRGILTDLVHKALSVP